MEYEIILEYGYKTTIHLPRAVTSASISTHEFTPEEGFIDTHRDRELIV